MKLDPGPNCFTCDAYLFDIDGTLLNNRDGVHYHAFHNAVRDIFGVDSSIDGVPVHGNTDIGILRAVVRRAGLSDADFEARLPQVLDHMRDEVTRNQVEVRPELCPSVSDVLAALKRAGKSMGVVSGNLEVIGWIKLRAAGIADYFSSGSFSDGQSAATPSHSTPGAHTSASHGTTRYHELRSQIFQQGIRQARARHGDQASVCVVGDTPSDIAAARECGIPVIAVATGIYSHDQLMQHRPDACFTCCTDLLQHLL